jgi:hypothetical protein
MKQTDEPIRIQLATILSGLCKFEEREVSEKQKKWNEFMRVFSQYIFCHY